ncbi:MAG: hypothetical protein WBB18_03785 [Nodosilinea sp.]
MKPLITTGLTMALLGGLGLAAFSQTTQQPPGTQSVKQQPEGRGRGHGRLAAAAAELGVSETDLKTALGLPAEPPPRPDLAAAAAQLGISEADLQDAMHSGSGERGQRLATAAAELNISEANLRTALGLPAEPPPRPDLAAAAAQLGVSEADLQNALRNGTGDEHGPKGNCSRSTEG